MGGRLGTQQGFSTLPADLAGLSLPQAVRIRSSCTVRLPTRTLATGPSLACWAEYAEERALPQAAPGSA